LSGLVPGQPGGRPLQQEEAADPQGGDEQAGWLDAQEDERLGELGSGDGNREDGDDERRFEDELEGRGPVGQGAVALDADGVEQNEDDGLNGDAAEDVPDGDPEVVGEGGAGGDGDLGEIGGQCQQDEPAERFAHPEPGRQHGGGVGELDPSEPDGAG
jgi:hypothetical protein